MRQREWSVRATAILTAMWVFVGSACGADLPDLAGTWALVQVFPQIAALPLAGQVSRSSTVALLVDVEQEGAKLTMRDRYCFTDVDDGTILVHTVIPEAFMASLVPTPRIAWLETEGDIVRFAQEPYLEVRGAVLCDPATESLPINPADPRVDDQDEDGHPGMTVRVTVLGIVKGETYIVQRVRYGLIGEVVDLDRIEGRIDWTDEQSVLAATNPLLEADTIGLPDPDPAAHRFVMVRIDATWSCDTLRERLAEILELGA